MYECMNCGSTFEEPRERITSWAKMYGIEPRNEVPIIETVCPYCCSEEIEEREDEE